MAQEPGQPAAHLDQQFVTCPMSEGVVHELEVIEIEKQDRHRCGLVVLFSQGVLDTIVEQVPVGQVRQAIVEGPVTELALEVPSFGHVS